MVKVLASALADNLRRIRNNRGITQSELAERADVAFNTIQAIEYGRSRGQVDTVSRIAAVLGVTVEELCGFDPPAERMATLTESQIEKIAKQAASISQAKIEAITEKAVAAAMEALNKSCALNQNPSQPGARTAMVAKINSMLQLLSHQELKDIIVIVQERVSKPKPFKPGVDSP